LICVEPLQSSREADFVSVTAARHAERRPRALFLSIPAYGHIRPLIIQARALARRGWDVRLASMDEARSFVEPRVSFEGLGMEAPGFPRTADVFARATAEVDFRKGLREIVAGVHALWGTLYDGALGLGRRWTPDLIVSDMVTTCGVDVAETLGVPHVFNNADILPVVSEALLPPATAVPLMLTGRSLATLSFIDRAMYHPLRVLGITMARRIARQTLDPVRAARGLPPADPITRAAGKRVLVNTAFGLEYERPLPPEIHLVGPMLDDEDPGLTPELDAWLSAGPPVVFASLGTLAAPAAAFVTALARGLDDATFRTLLVLRGEPADIARRTSPGLRIEPWVSSQMAVLRHPNTRAFVSHCGVNSVHEAVICGVPIVGIPLFADQQDMAFRALDAGVALVLAKHALKPDAVRAAVRRVAEESSFRRPMPRLQAALRAAGGVERAADLLEDAACSFWTRQFAHPWSRCHAEV
jgi:UDP:flavonoid glycosyltransferase YjiC (YdhE family)